MSPLSVGVGSVPVQPSSIDLAPRASRASGAEPPPEKVRPTAVATGSTAPSGRRRRVVSTGTQRSFLRTRMGLTFSSMDSVPSGLAKTVRVSLRIDSISTGRPAPRAWATAATSLSGGGCVVCGRSSATTGRTTARVVRDNAAATSPCSTRIRDRPC